MKIKSYLSLLCCCIISLHSAAKEKELVDFFLPMDTYKHAVIKPAWGIKDVPNRDVSNGLEGKSVKDKNTGEYLVKDWCYWDGSIVKDEKGKYHLYASRWSQKMPHGIGWTKDSKGIHSVSDNLYGPYKDMGLTWSDWNGGKGTNVVGLKMSDGRYALIASEIVPGEVFVSDSPNGSFSLLGDFKIDANGYYDGWGRYNELDDGALRGGSVGFLANVMIITRPDGRYMMLARHCVPMISDSGILGPYKMTADKAWLNVNGIPQYKMEDPTIWYSDGLYHIVVNFHGKDETYHLTSEDGIHNWKYRGIAFKKDLNVFRHKDGTVEHWNTIQRPTVYLEDGIVKAFNFSVIDVHKGRDNADDTHGSKIIVVPFDGVSFGKNIANIVAKENEQIDNTPLPSEWRSCDIGSVALSGNSGFDSIVNTMRVKTSGSDFSGNSDACRYVYQKVNGDISSQTMVMCNDIYSGSIKSGLMLRSSLDPNSACVIASISKDNKLEIFQRCNDNMAISKIKTLNISAPYWIRFRTDKNKVKIYISSSNRTNWENAATLDMDLNGQYYAGLVSTSVDDKLALCRFKDSEIHNYGFPKKGHLVMQTFPDTIPSSGVVNFEAEIESEETADIWVELENIKTGKKYKVLRTRYWDSGNKKLTYNAGEPLEQNCEYWVTIKVVPMHFHDSERIDSYFKKVHVEN